MLPAAMPVLPATWADVLDRVQQALEQTAAEAAKRAATCETHPSPHEAESAWRRALEAFSERLQRLQEAAQYAGQSATDADTALATAEAELQRWQAAAAASGRRLADWAAGEV